MLLSGVAFGQMPVAPKPDWQLLDLQTDGVFGISMEKAYAELLKGKPHQRVIVAVIDGGIDINHPDLKNVIWTNPGEIPANRKDDDHNGYIDDVHGWNFLGSPQESYEYDNDEPIPTIRNYQARYGNLDSTQVAKNDLPEYRKYLALKADLQTKLGILNAEIAGTKQFLQDLGTALKKMGNVHPSVTDFEKFIPANAPEKHLRDFMISALQRNPDFDSYVARGKAKMEDDELDVRYHLNMDYQPRAKYAEEYAPSKGRFYGNADVVGPVPPLHATHVTGIIAADRTNNIGIKGVADDVRIMPLRAIPDGGGRDIDEANAIRYAADNGARVINMSFGLSVANDREALVAAVNYALAKGVLFIQAAGNGGDNLDEAISYPDRRPGQETGIEKCFIKVGASGFTNDEQAFAPFSNYGAHSVDVFAPGVAITSTIPDNKYEAHSGTSMAAPVVAGLAGVIMEYYPKLTAAQVKEIIMQTVVKAAALKDKCVSGGVVNAYAALKLAAVYK